MITALRDRKEVTYIFLCNLSYDDVPVLESFGFYHGFFFWSIGSSSDSKDEKQVNLPDRFFAFVERLQRLFKKFVSSMVGTIQLKDIKSSTIITRIIPKLTPNRLRRNEQVERN